MMPFVPNLDKDKIGLGELQQFLTDWKYPKHVISGGIFNAQLQKSTSNLEKKKRFYSFYLHIALTLTINQIKTIKENCRTCKINVKNE